MVNLSKVDKRRFIKRQINNGIQIKFGVIQALDGSDMAVFNEFMKSTKPGSKIEIDLDGVIALPSGFFGILVDSFDRKIEINIINTSPKVCSYLWYQMFFKDGQMIDNEQIPGPETGVCANGSFAASGR